MYTHTYIRSVESVKQTSGTLYVDATALLLIIQRLGKLTLERGQSHGVSDERRQRVPQVYSAPATGKTRSPIAFLQRHSDVKSS